MFGTQLSKSRFSHLPRIFGRAAIVVVPAVLLITFVTVRILHHFEQNQQQMAVYSLIPDAPDLENMAASAAAGRPIFPYSIIPGGVRNSDELQKAAAHDPVVAQHYSDFHIVKARAIRLEKPVEMYVSYRRNNKVYWTKNRMLIPAGETLISDGENLARVRCANRLSKIAALPVAETEPTREELSTPNFVPPLLAELFPGESADIFPGGFPAVRDAALPQQFPLPPGGATPGTGVFSPLLPPSVAPFTPLIPPPVSTPEPSSIWMVLLGAALIGIFTTLVARRNGSA